VPDDTFVEKGTNTMNSKTTSPMSWRVRDIIIASVLGVTMGVLFAVWNVVNTPLLDPLGALMPGVSAIGHGVWLLGGIVTALVVKKPGSAFYGEFVAATVSALVGNQWGVLTLLYGAVQGLGAEIVFALFLYRAWGLLPALLAGLGSGIAMAMADLTLFYAALDTQFKVVYASASVLSGVLVAGLGGWLLARALQRAGVVARS
jgi:energy-coupling factor transport system substrate-specific component